MNQTRQQNSTGPLIQKPQTDLLLTVILCWTWLVAGVLVWLPLVRSTTQGNPYRWTWSGTVGGVGTAGDYWLLLVAMVFIFSLMYLGWRGARRPFHWLLLLFHLPLAAAVGYAAWTNPKDLRWEGATIGVNISLAKVGPALFGGFAILSILWVVRDLKAGRTRALVPWMWTRSSRIRLILILAAVPVEVVLFHAGGIQSMQNLIGVSLVFWQWAMVNRVLAASSSRTGPGG